MTDPDGSRVEIRQFSKSGGGSSRPIIFATLLRDEGETGVHSHMRVFGEYLQGKGREVRVITPFSNARSFVYPLFAVRRCIDPLSGPLSVWWYRYWHCLFLRLALRRELEGGGEVTVYAQCPLSARAALQARKGGGQRVVMAVHFNGSQALEWAQKGRIRENGHYYRRMRELEKMVLTSLDGIVFVSRFMQGVLERDIPGIGRVPAVVVPNFTTLPRPCSGDRPLGDLVSIGTLEPRKNQGFLLRVVAAALRLGRRYSLTLIGDGPDRASLRAMAVALGIGDQVLFLGYRPEAAALLSGHRIYVHGAAMENLPMALIEALACGLPVAAAPVGGIPEIFRDGVEGIYWRLTNPVSAAEALIGLLEDDDRYRAAARSAIDRFRAGFYVESAAPLLEDFLSSVCAGPGSD